MHNGFDVKIKSQSLYLLLAYGMLGAYMIGPSLSYRVGIPRIDNPLTLLFILSSCLIFLLESKTFPAKAGKALLALTIMAGWSLLHIIFSSVSATLFADLMMFAVLPCYFYILYLIISRAPDQLKFIQRFILFFLAFITLPAFIELLTGFQFVYADEAYSVDSGTLKGLFFNPNNLSTTALCLAPAVLVFFNLLGKSKKEVALGWLLFLLLGLTIFASVSRTAIVCYLVLLLLYLVYRNNGLLSIFMLAATALLFSMIPSNLSRIFYFLSTAMNFWSASHPVCIYFCMISKATTRFLTDRRFIIISGTIRLCSIWATAPKIFVNFLADTSAAAWASATRTALSSSSTWASASFLCSAF